MPSVMWCHVYTENTPNARTNTTSTPKTRILEKNRTNNKKYTLEWTPTRRCRIIHKVYCDRYPIIMGGSLCERVLILVYIVDDSVTNMGMRLACENFGRGPYTIPNMVVNRRFQIGSVCPILNCAIARSKLRNLVGRWKETMFWV